MQVKITANKYNSGQVVLLVMFIIVFFMILVGLFISNMILKQLIVTRNIANSVQAYYVADAGTEISLYNLKTAYSGSLVSGTLISENSSLPGVTDGQYTATVIEGGGTALLRIKVLGVYRNTARAVELNWGG